MTGEAARVRQTESPETCVGVTAMRKMMWTAVLSLAAFLTTTVVPAEVLASGSKTVATAGKGKKSKKGKKSAKKGKKGAKKGAKKSKKTAPAVA
jgi:hypothetical protein